MRLTQTSILIADQENQIEGLLDCQGEADKGFIAVNCHPHPLYGGSMTNKVVHTLSKTFAQLGIPSYRFNFRGVGSSSGTYDHGVGEQEDLISVIDWVKRQHSGRKLILTGFSFGAYVSILASKQVTPDLLISVAPPVGRFPLELPFELSMPWTVIMGDQDELVDFGLVEQWVRRLPNQPNLLKISGASHFFHGKLVLLSEQIKNIVRPLMENVQGE